MGWLLATWVSDYEEAGHAKRAVEVYGQHLSIESRMECELWGYLARGRETGIHRILSLQARGGLGYCGLIGRGTEPASLACGDAGADFEPPFAHRYRWAAGSWLAWNAHAAA